MGFRFLFVGDIHATERSPRSRKDKIFESFDVKMKEIKDFVDEYGVQCVIHAGDLFHSTDATRVSYRLVNYMYRWIRSLDVPFLMVPGNHDMESGKVSSLFRRPLGLLFEANVAQNLLEGVYVAEGLDIAVWGKEDLSVVDFPDSESFNIVVTHQPVLPERRRWFEKSYYTYEALQKKSLDMVLFGHLHWDCGIVQLDNARKTIVANPGAILRLASHEHDLKRKPYVILFEVCEDRLVNRKKLYLRSAKPIEEVFDLETIERRRARDIEITMFTESLKASTDEILVLNPVEMLDAYCDEHPVEEEIYHLAREFLVRSSDE